MSLIIPVFVQLVVVPSEYRIIKVKKENVFLIFLYLRSITYKGALPRSVL